MGQPRPYFGQAIWFIRFHSEQVPSAIERYKKETQRVLGVLDGVLAKQPSGWLVGGKCTIADISFITWNRLAFNVSMKDVNVEKEYPHVWAYVCFPCCLGVHFNSWWFLI